MLVDYLYPFVKVKMMILQSLYDSWVAPYILGIPCVAKGLDSCNSSSMAILDQHRVNTLKLIKLIINTNKKSSAFGIACSRHVLEAGAFYNPNYKIKGSTAVLALSRFLAG